MHLRHSISWSCSLKWAPQLKLKWQLRWQFCEVISLLNFWCNNYRVDFWETIRANGALNTHTCTHTRMYTDTNTYTDTTVGNYYLPPARYSRAHVHTHTHDCWRILPPPARYTHTHTYALACTHTHTHTHTTVGKSYLPPVRWQTRASPCVQCHTCRVRIYVWMYTCLYVCIHMYVCIYVYYTYILTRTCTIHVF